MQKISKKLDDTLASMQGLEISAELMEQSLRGNPNYLKTREPFVFHNT